MKELLLLQRILRWFMHLMVLQSFVSVWEGTLIVGAAALILGSGYTVFFAYARRTLAYHS